MKIHQPWLVVMCVLMALSVTTTTRADRIKDLVTIAGLRANQLVGYSLVVGLNSTGDQTTQTPFTIQSIRNMLVQFGVNVPSGSVDPQLKNVAAVTVQAELPPFAKIGQRIDITVASIGNAKSLRGGSLLMAPLRGADGNVYAIAQGNLVVGGFGAKTKDGSRVTVNVPSAGRVPSGATVERTVPTAFMASGSVELNLKVVDFTTTKRMVDTINAAFSKVVAQPIDGSTVRVEAPANPAQRIAFVSALENLTLEPGEVAARVVINSRTGTIVIGDHVRVMPAAVAHGSLTVTITKEPIISQPGPLSGGQTVVAEKTDIEISEEGTRMFLFEPGVTLDTIVRAVNQVGAAPGDLVAILEALKQAGALRADLIII
ncbi:MAG TPA: flagellar basal body P-ring protein FlgI [Acidiferrobacteraceae bacterium]|nr:flagellar basal body P-ring protein FlgI [Acidiferrobacteraceae bacterium]